MMDRDVMMAEAMRIQHQKVLKAQQHLDAAIKLIHEVVNQRSETYEASQDMANAVSRVMEGDFWARRVVFQLAKEVEEATAATQAAAILRQPSAPDSGPDIHIGDEDAADPND